jgi:hypothetical protein
VWQLLYEELRGQGFVIIAVALDTGGTAATEVSIRCTDLDERPEVLATALGWSEDVWQRQRPPTYPCLIDEEHLVADLYGMTNVPTAVWIDEEGRIARPAEPAGFSDSFRRRDANTYGLPNDEVERLKSNRRVYWDAIRDWVGKGHESVLALSAEEVQRRRRTPREEDVRAAAHARIGRHLFRQGQHAAAARHLEEAVRLCPEKWNYRRQSMVLEPDLVGKVNASPRYFAATAALGDAAYYAPVDIPGFRPDPLVKAPPGAPPA